MAQAKMTFPITKEIRKDQSRFWKTDNLNLANILREAGNNVQFSIWNKPDDYDEQNGLAKIEVGPPYKGKPADSPYTYQDNRGNTKVYIGLWERHGTDKKGENFSVLGSSSIDVGAIKDILGQDVVIYISRSKERKTDKSPHYGCTIAAKRRDDNNNAPSSGNTSSQQTQADANKEGIPF